MTSEIIKYRKWLEQNVKLEDPFSPSSVRLMVLKMLLGANYRLQTERNTKEKLFATYALILKVCDDAQTRYGKQWREKLLDELTNLEGKGRTEKDLVLWLLGLTKKTSDNLDISADGYVDFLRQTIEYCDELFSRIKNPKDIDRAWLLLMAGHATLNIRGSQKSAIGKRLEKIFAKTALTLLGFELEKNFWMNIERDEEVGREADAEVESKRGRVRIEVGLIASGNQEVIEDKIARVGANGVVICDRLGPKSSVYGSADRANVELIQIRNNQPLLHLRNYLSTKVKIKLNAIPSTEAALKAELDKLPDDFFTIVESPADA